MNSGGDRLLHQPARRVPGDENRRHPGERPRARIAQRPHQRQTIGVRQIPVGDDQMRRLHQHRPIGVAGVVEGAHAMDAGGVEHRPHDRLHRLGIVDHDHVEVLEGDPECPIDSDVRHGPSPVTAAPPIVADRPHAPSPKTPRNDRTRPVEAAYRADSLRRRAPFARIAADRHEATLAHPSEGRVQPNRCIFKAFDSNFRDRREVVGSPLGRPRFPHPWTPHLAAVATTAPIA